MTFDQIKQISGTYVNAIDGLTVVVFRCDEVFGVCDSKYSGPQLYELDKAGLTQHGWMKAPRQIKVTFEKETVSA